MTAHETPAGAPGPEAGGRDDDLVELTTRPNEMDAGLIREVLAAAGIESTQHVADGFALGVFGANMFNPVTVRVRRHQLSEARAALEQNRQDSVDIDWSEVDVGEPQDEIARRLSESAEPVRTRKSSRAELWVMLGVAVVAGALAARMGWLPLLAVLVFVFTLAVLRLGRR